MENHQIELHKIDTDIKYPTEIEESLDSSSFYEALKITIETSKDENIIDVFNKFDFDSDSKNSFIKGDNSIIYPKSEVKFDGNPQKEKEKIIDFINKNKKKICDNYC